ncbi:hypothetical protein [Pseudoduganella danionis]|uniref:hypothetical protein n=1 Tax=Pseudoduganella danionis TaxID=1890295 RepID=UPI0035AE10EB
MDYNPDCPAWGNLTWPKVGEFDLANGENNFAIEARDDGFEIVTFHVFFGWVEVL